MVACGTPFDHEQAAYGIACFPEADSGVCSPCVPPAVLDSAGNCIQPSRDAGPDSGITDGGSDGYVSLPDAYGIGPLPNDGGPDSGSDE